MIYISQLHGPRSNATGFIDPETFSSCFLVTVSQGSSSKVPLSAKLPEDPFEGPAALPHACWRLISGSILPAPTPPPNCGPKSECVAASKVVPVSNGTSHRLLMRNTLREISS